MGRKHVVVVGGSFAGMTTALALSQQGHRVTVLEKERLPRCETSVEAFELWERRGSPQSRHSHAFLARVHNAIRERAPKLYADLIEAGAEPLPFTDMVSRQFENPQFEPEDEEIVLLGCRRITFDWVLRRHLEAHSDCEYRDGVAVDSLLAEPDADSGLPRVVGVSATPEGGAQEELSADLVVDASGRNSKLRGWLEAIGSAPLEQESNDCGIYYCSRFYRLLDGGEPPPMDGPIGGDLGYLKYAIFAGDSNIFSITLAPHSHDEKMRCVRLEDAFHSASLALPATQGWVDPSVSQPITGVYAYANLKNTLRYFVKDERPLVLGLFPIGDSLVHANPITGRGCTLAWLGAYLLADAYTAAPNDPMAFATALHAEIVEQLVPWYINMRDQDLAAAETTKIQESGRDPFEFKLEDGSLDPKAYIRSVMRDGLKPAMGSELPVMRAVMRVFNMLDAPSDILKDSNLRKCVMAVWEKREEREAVQMGPTRSEMIEHLSAAGIG